MTRGFIEVTPVIESEKKKVIHIKPKVNKLIPSCPAALIRGTHLSHLWPVK